MRCLLSELESSTALTGQARLRVVLPAAADAMPDTVKNVMP